MFTWPFVVTMRTCNAPSFIIKQIHIITSEFKIQNDLKEKRLKHNDCRIRPTDGWTDGYTDRPTYKVACMRPNAFNALFHTGNFFSLFFFLFFFLSFFFLLCLLNTISFPSTLVKSNLSAYLASSFRSFQFPVAFRPPLLV